MKEGERIFGENWQAAKWKTGLKLKEEERNNNQKERQ